MIKYQKKREMDVFLDIRGNEKLEIFHYPEGNYHINILF